MVATTEAFAGNKVLEDVFQNIRRAAESSLKMHQEIFHQFTHMWPFPTPQSIWVDKARDFQKQWASTVTELVRKHREVVDKQFESAIGSFDAALRVTEATSPEEYRRRSEQLCRKSLDCVREISETHLNEFQDAILKCTELMTKPSS
jgi:hypothetical protein